jgi:hypothetical protein
LADNIDREMVFIVSGPMVNASESFKGEFKTVFFNGSTEQEAETQRTVRIEIEISKCWKETMVERKRVEG